MEGGDIEIEKEEVKMSMLAHELDATLWKP